MSTIPRPVDSQPAPADGRSTRPRDHAAGDPRRPGSDAAPTADPRARIGHEVARRVGPRRWDMWFDRGTEFVIEDGSLRVEAESRFVADWIERHFREAIQTAARAELGE